MAAPRVSEEEFVDLNLLETVPHIFDGDRDRYLNWRRDAAERLGVDPRNVLIVGSACHGFSIKNKKPFSPSSDVDVAVISAPHFDESWRYLRTVRLGTVVCTVDQREHIKGSAARYVYQGCIATDYILPLLPFGPKWQRVSARIGRALPGGTREVNFRLYREIEALRQYQERSHRKFRENWEK